MKSVFIFLLLSLSSAAIALPHPEVHYYDRARFQVRSSNSGGNYKYSIEKEAVEIYRSQNYVNLSVTVFPAGGQPYADDPEFHSLRELNANYVTDLNTFCHQRSGSIEELDLPAGHFKTCKVNSALPGSPSGWLQWFAEGVPFGVVQEETSRGGESTHSELETYVRDNIPMEMAAAGPWSLSTGLYHGCAYTENWIQCFRMLERGGTEIDPELKPPPNLKGILQVSSATSSCALTHSGIVCWGKDQQIMNPPALNDVTSIAVGDDGFACAIAESRVHCWGNSYYKVEDVPADLPEVRSLTAGDGYACVITTDQSLRCWGRASVVAKIPSNLQGVTAIAQGGSHVCAVVAGEAKCWGENAAGESTVPSGLEGVVSIAAGNSFTCASTTSGTQCWGKTDYDSDGLALAPPADLEPSAELFAAGSIACAKTARGFACWGK